MAEFKLSSVDSVLALFDEGGTPIAKVGDQIKCLFDLNEHQRGLITRAANASNLTVQFKGFGGKMIVIG